MEEKPVQVGETFTADGPAYILPDGTIIPLSFDSSQRIAQVRALNSILENLTVRPFIHNYFYQPPWGDAIPISGKTRKEQDEDIERLQKWYKQFPTKESFEAQIPPSIGTSTKWEPWVTYKTNAPVLPIDEPPCKGCTHWRPVVEFDTHGNFDGVRLCHADEMFHDFSCYVERKTDK